MAAHDWILLAGGIVLLILVALLVKRVLDDLSKLDK